MDELEKLKQTKWAKAFDERQLKQIAFSRVYARDFAHGADSHNNMLIIAKMAAALDTEEAKHGAAE